VRRRVQVLAENPSTGTIGEEARRNMSGDAHQGSDQNEFAIWRGQAPGRQGTMRANSRSTHPTSNAATRDGSALQGVKSSRPGPSRFAPGGLAIMVRGWQRRAGAKARGVDGGGPNP